MNEVSVMLCAQGLEAAQQAAPADAATVAQGASCRDRLEAARQLESCWGGLRNSWLLHLEPAEIIAAAAAVAYPSIHAADVSSTEASGGSAMFDVLGCKDLPVRWAAAGLPADEQLTVRAAAMQHARRLPVMADPNGIGSAWVRHMHKNDARLQVCCSTAGRCRCVNPQTCWHDVI